jgi:hypothetical protein
MQIGPLLVAQPQPAEAVVPGAGATVAQGVRERDGRCGQVCATGKAYASRRAPVSLAVMTSSVPSRYRVSTSAVQMSLSRLSSGK